MRLKGTHLAKILPDDFIPFSKTISNRKPKAKLPNKKPSSVPSSESSSAQNADHQSTTPNAPEYRENEMQIQMLSRTLYEQIFKKPGTPLVADKVKA